MKQTDWRLERLFQAVALFDQTQILDQAVARFRKHDWVVHEFDCENFSTQEEFLNDILHQTSVFGWDYTYENINMIQFWDLLRDAQVPEETGLVLAFKNFNAFKSEYPEFFDELLNSIAREHYYQLTRGRKMMVCAHVNDRTIQFKPVLVVKASWNEQQGFDEEADRRVEEFKRDWEQNKDARLKARQKFREEKGWN